MFVCVCVYCQLVRCYFLKFLESDFTICSSAQHSQHCDILDMRELTTAERQYFSSTYGVNRRALMDSLQYFSVASSALVPDIMHDILEGAMLYEIKLMLKVNFCLESCAN